jgi:hypothetical protein
MSFINKIRRWVGGQKFADGSTVAPLTRESLLYVDPQGRELEIPFIFTGKHSYNIYVKKRDGINGDRLTTLAMNLENYCKSRDFEHTFYFED